MNIKCPKCNSPKKNISKNGFFRRKSDSKVIQKFICRLCGKQFSQATFSACYHQNKRRINYIVRASLCSSMSMRRIALIHNISRTTVKRKLEFLASQAANKQKVWLQGKVFKHVEFDDLETFEHTKCKPISLTMAVESKTRKIIGFKLSEIGPRGLLTKAAHKKYGKRTNESYRNRRLLFKELQEHIDEGAVFKSDMHVQYSRLVKAYFPKATHRLYKGERAKLSGFGELKDTSFDPLFSINHSFAMLRANVNRLARKTWCTTKQMKFLEMHLRIYIDFHNQVLT